MSTPKHMPGALTIRQVRIMFQREHDAVAAESTARLINAAWADHRDWEKSRPKTLWRKGANGLWSHA